MNMKMTPDKFSYLLAVVEEKNITRAAEKLYISQPALTSYINKVEDYYGVKLFNRSQNPVTLTYAGEKFMKEMSNIIHLQQKLDNDMEELASHRAGRMTIGIGNTRGCDWLPYLLPAYKSKYPEIDIKIIEGNCNTFEQKLLSGTMDFSITTLPLNTKGIDYEVIQEEKVYLVIPQGHPILEGKDISNNCFNNPLSVAPEELTKQTFLSPGEGYGLYRYTFKVFEDFNIMPGEMIEINNSDTAFQLACYGAGLVLTPESSFMPPLPQRMPVIALINNQPMIRYVVAAYNSSIGLSSSAKDFIEITKDIVNNEPILNIHTYYGS